HIIVTSVGALNLSTNG
ncbi:lysE type translocator family protein, partial [Vibrio harveyi]